MSFVGRLSLFSEGPLSEVPLYSSCNIDLLLTSDITTGMKDKVMMILESLDERSIKKYSKVSSSSSLMMVTLKHS